MRLQNYFRGRSINVRCIKLKRESSVFAGLLTDITLFWGIGGGYMFGHLK